MNARALTADEMLAILDSIPPAPHHIAVAADVMPALLSVAVRREATAHDVMHLAGMPVHIDRLLPPGTWEPRNRDGSRFVDPNPLHASPPHPEP